MTAPESAPPSEGARVLPRPGPLRGVPTVESYGTVLDSPEAVRDPSAGPSMTWDAQASSGISVSSGGACAAPRHVSRPRITTYSDSPEVIDAPGATLRRAIAVDGVSSARQFAESPIVRAVLGGTVKVNPAYHSTNSKISCAEDLVQHTKKLRARALKICPKDTVPRRQITAIKNTTPILWELPGHGSDTRASCGAIMGIDCCPEGHTIQPYHWYCGNPRCPTCMSQWASRTKPMVARLSCLGQRMDGPRPVADWAGMGLYHAVLSPPQEMSIGALGIADGKRAFDDAINIACAIIGFHGTWDLHSWRHGKGRNATVWRDGPHAHLVGWLNPEVAIDIAQAVLVPMGWTFKIVRYKRSAVSVDDGDGDLDDVYGPNGTLTEEGVAIVLRYIRTHVSIGVRDGCARRFEVGHWVGRCARTRLRVLVDSDHYVDANEIDEPMLGEPDGGMDDPEEWGMDPVPPPTKRVPMRLRCYCAVCQKRIVHTWPVPGGLERPVEFHYAYLTAVAWGDSYYRGRYARKQYRVAMCLKEDLDAIRDEYGDIDGPHLEQEALRRRDRRLAFWAEDAVAEIQPDAQWDAHAREWKDYDGPVDHLHADNPFARMARYFQPAPSPPWPAPRLPRGSDRPPSRR